MGNWIFLQILLDIFFIVTIGYCVHRFRKEDQFSRKRKSNERKLEAFLVSLERAVREGRQMSASIVEDVESRQQNLAMFTQLMDKEKKALRELLEEVKSAGYNSQSTKQKFQEAWINDKYDKALKLSAEGFSPQEIADRIKLPVEEIEQVLSFRK